MGHPAVLRDGSQSESQCGSRPPGLDLSALGLSLGRGLTALR